ncbi:uncharacterized protein LOC108913295 [Anoplophora glabripennis]|uniref:uncharacterized protein LOC108913295 n=1 Tax=Anoplophora glabripennis TaxID=217634 RepID=UPI000874F1A7|nr:uncharacterized protein LOC108913295 [Anoplophora glabripennis]
MALFDNTPIERKATPGPLMPKEVNEVGTSESDTEKQFTSSVKKTPKESNLNQEGRISIISQVEGPKEALCIKYNEDFDYIGVGYNDGVIRVYQSTTGKEALQLSDDDVKNKRSPVTSIKHRPVSKVYPVTNCFTGTYANGFIKCWNYNLNQCLYSIKEKRQTFGLTYHPRVPKFVTYGDDSRICFYDEESKTMERVLLPSDNPTIHDGHTSRVFAACFHPRNNYELITGGWDDLIHYWDLRQPHAIRHISGIHMCGEGLDINMRGTEILACAFQPSDPLQIFDYASAKRVSCIEPDIYACRLYCGRYASKDFIVSGGTDQNLFRVIDMQTITTVANITGLPGAVYALDLGPVKKKVEKPKDHSARPKSDISLVPKIAFISAKKVFQIECY